ncbi:hypothetical protein [Hespellia stercorisuis]|uniref:Uncharacterized protein n=1 Tax=Hespellia stercorisuis DSM 15480 TaxID=1121950 RepID=A0A1M6RP74_9FIRM|nr:hypothetical protein [Hespellia stercorisuis]SHK34272.1 hypothetical protein SAMN02745243_02750 [Hespellia stercorisuis DSM 15480]
MDIKTKCGMNIHCLPDTAKCKESGKNPESMEQCPIYNFDDNGWICVPELCDSYTEE